MTTKPQPFTATIAYVLISLVIIIYGMHILAEVIIPFAFAGILAILLLPLCRRLERWHVPRVLAITICILVFTSVLALLFYVAYSEIASFEDVLPQLSEKTDNLWRNVQIFIRDNFHISRRKQTVEGQKYLTQWLQDNASMITNTLSTTTSIISNLVLIPLYVFLILYYRNFLHQFLHQVFGEENRENVDTVVFKMKTVIQDYLIGLMILILIIGALDTVGLLILGIDYAFFFGFFAAFLVLIPYIGISIGSLLPILMALITKDSGWYAVGVAGLFMTVQFLEGNFITPYVVGSKVSINSMAAIIALILFGNLWGIPGLILAIPLTAIIKVVFDSVEGLKPYGYLIGEVVHPKK